MKNTYLLLSFLVVCSFTTYGQDYHRLLNETTYWDISGAAMGYICSGFSDNPPRRFSFSGDTLINGKFYAKTYSRKLIPIGYTPPPNCPPFYVDTIATVSGYYFLREDTLQKKVWRYDEVNDDEILLYDFSLEQGDTLYHEIIVEPTVIDTVYEIVTDDGKTRMKFELEGGYMGGYYIEGIGGVAGLFSRPFYYFEAGSWLMCVKDLDNNVILDIDGNCYDFITSTSETNQVIPARIFPNPFKEWINVESEKTITHVIIYNKLGQVVLTKNTRAESAIDLSDLVNGIYLIKVMSNNTEVLSEKLIKNNGL